MKRYPMPKDYVRQLREHRYVEAATEWTVSFTVEFQQHAYDEYYRGKSMREIFVEAGFDVEKLGRKRLENFRTRLMEKAAEESGFTDKRKDKSLQAPLSNEAALQKRIRELERRNAYLEQEIEFLKKIQELEKGSAGKAGGRK